MYNVQEYGADSSGSTDSASAFQAAIDAARAKGGRVFIPDGRYKISRTLVLDETSAPASGPDGSRVQIVGEGCGSSEIEFTGSGPLLKLLGGHQEPRVASLQALRDLRLIGSGIGSVGLKLDNCAYFSATDIYLSGFETAIDMTDCLTSQFERVIVRWNGLGIHAHREDGSRPNAITFNHCVVSNNIYGGGHFEQAAGVTFHGGTVESNGSHASQDEGFGIKLTESCAQGAVAASFFGTWFENNKGRADVWMIQRNRPAVVGFHGTTLARVSAAQFVTNHVYIENGDHEVVVAALGVGARNFNDYVPSPDRPVISATRPTSLRVEAWGTQISE